MRKFFATTIPAELRPGLVLLLAIIASVGGLAFAAALAQAHPIEASTADVGIMNETARSFELAALDPVEIMSAPAPVASAPEIARPKPQTVDDYLWQVYNRTPVKIDGSGDFTWKDPAAARRVKMDVSAYTIGGMDRDFREQLYHAGKKMDAAGLCWSIYSAFRDDYRQGIASGFKASGGNSRHGGSRATCGYGCGQAVDIAACDKTPIGAVLRFIDAIGRSLGLYRPMPGSDPSHVQPTSVWRQLARALRLERTGVAEPVAVATLAPGEGRAIHGKAKFKRHANRHRGARHAHTRRHRAHAAQTVAPSQPQQQWHAQRRSARGA